MAARSAATHLFGFDLSYLSLALLYNLAIALVIKVDTDEYAIYNPLPNY
ncbi:MULTISPECIES: hypothetical protein [Pseudanabaena]|nr:MULTISPECIES: hypothetical protein [Pseudanabaena]WGS71086.1 hypothetical protein OA858_15330 [Pseudanabaena galeata CCNP1313]